ncbi:MAG: ATP-binding protein [Actinomycetota bacterium]|nr:ATP-binding protein [Actinomycetota bacterium]
MREQRASRRTIQIRPAWLAAAAAEILGAVAGGTAAVAALQSIAPPAGLGVLYLLAVLAVAIRRGELAALATAFLSVLTLNYLFIAPRHRLAVAHSQDVVELVVFLIAAVVVGRLAVAGRQRAAEAESRARLALAREREAKLLAETASAILASRHLDAQLGAIANRIAHATGASRARVALESAPSPGAGELATRLAVEARPVWLYISTDTAWGRGDLERLTEPLGRLIDVAVERDRIAQRAAETEAGRSVEAARTAILHSVSHDLRSPLTAIMTAGSALRAVGVAEAERAELTDIIETESARLARLVDDLLDLSKIQAGALAPAPDWCDIHDAVASSAAHVRTGHPLELALPADLPLVRVDAAQLERVLSNLIENAVKFSPPGSAVRVSAGQGGGRVTVRVTDRGRGIPSQHRAHVFEPFFRGRSGSGSGSGLGLAICRGFVEANGGRIVLQSDAERGTSFAVSFPLARQPQALR